jgi:hypothetical protein
MRNFTLLYGGLFVVSFLLTTGALRMNARRVDTSPPVMAAPEPTAGVAAVGNAISHWVSQAMPALPQSKPKAAPPVNNLPSADAVVRQNAIDELNRVRERVRALRIQLDRTEDATERPAVVRALFNLFLSSGDPTGEIRELIRMATLDGDEQAAAAAKQIYDQLPPPPAQPK